MRYVVLVFSLSLFHLETNLDPSHFTRKKGEPESNADSRRKTQMEAEQNAVTTIALYLATMGFCQKGINELNRCVLTYSCREVEAVLIPLFRLRYCEEHIDGPKEPEGAEVSSGVNDGMQLLLVSVDLLING